MRLGLDGIITGNAMLADLMARIWDLHVRGKADALREAYAAFLLMRNLDEQIPGANLYLFKKRGIFKTAATQTTAPARVWRPASATTRSRPMQSRKSSIALRG